MTRMLCAAAALLLLATPAVSQEQRASIEGTIRDSSGGVLPGVTVEARSPSLAGVESTVSDSAGTYRFPALRPGRYDVTATLQGFQPAKSSDVRLELGQILKIDLAMQVGGVSETVKVTGESPLIDVKQNTAGANVEAETIERIPKGRDFANLVTSAPGITSEARNRGIQIDGASGADNRFLIDGVDTTNLLNGTSGKVLPPDFVDTVQAKASGYSAEYRASLGGVISAITKSGGNTYHGSAGIYYTGDNLQGDVRETLRLNPSNTTVAEYVTTPLDDYSSPEPIFDLGGPIMKDRLWFYVGYDPSWTNRTRTVLFNSTRQLGTFSQKPTVTLLNYNVSGQITKNLRGRFAASNQRDEGGYALAELGAARGQHLQPGALPVGRPPRLIERFVLGRSRLGREQQDLRQHDGDPLQGRSARRRHVQHGAAPRLPGLDEHLQRHRRSGIERLPVPGDSGEPPAGERVCGQPVELAVRARRLEPVQRQRRHDPLRELAWPAHAQGRLPGRADRRQHALGRAGGDGAAVLESVLRAQRRPPHQREVRLLQRRALRDRSAISSRTTSGSSCRIPGRSIAS